MVHQERTVLIIKLKFKLRKNKESVKKDGTSRANSTYNKIEIQVQLPEALLEKLKQEKKQLPLTVDISGLENYESYKVLDNEGKNLFDFVTTSVWNVRSRNGGALKSVLQ